MNYECPESDPDKFLRTGTPVSSHASQLPLLRVRTRTNLTPHPKGTKGGLTRRPTRRRPVLRVPSLAQTVEGKNKRAIRKALKKSTVDRSSSVGGMDIDISQAAPANAISVESSSTQGIVTTSTLVAIDRVILAGVKPNAHPKIKVPP
ncbi:hypothetical protein EVAR_31417_1 [Eumeta japonica]|uniref:Uncharacterized protein n=1 Tax=Eumeta variegata TaxID=151549 RepID=A0A4C1UZA5_EUMVA|nr:hypothetical protein EVAR_31417_1 [Eumeta japonica]